MDAVNRARLSFDPVWHSYKLDGATVPSVSRIIRPLSDFSKIPADILEAAADRGRRVHALCHAVDDGFEVEADHDDESGYLEAYKRFLADNDVQYQEIEKPIFHSDYRYAGTPDRIGTVNGVRCVVDIKTIATKHKINGVQVSAYSLAWESLYKEKLEIMALYLKASGIYRLTKYTVSNNWMIFASCLNIYQFTQKPIKTQKNAKRD